MANMIDSHTHIFANNTIDPEIVINNIKEENLDKVLAICCDIDQRTDLAVELAKNDTTFDLAIGIHPSDIKYYTNEVLDKVYNYCKLKQVVAVGEIGLDYHWDKDNKDIQKQWFIEQINIANKLNKPVIIHARDAIEDTYDILKNYPVNKKGVMHCFSSSYEMALKFIELGFYISFGGPVTFKNARVAKEVAEKIDINYLLCETDAPYLTPEPFRGTTNQAINVKYVYKQISELRNIKLDELKEVVSKNYNRLFHNEN